MSEHHFWTCPQCGNQYTSKDVRDAHACGDCEARSTQGTGRGQGWNLDRLQGFERHIVAKLDGSANCGVKPAGPYRAQLETELARVRRWITHYNEQPA